MYTLLFEDNVVRKADASGAGNDCVYLTSPTASDALVVDSKRHVALRLTHEARAQLVKIARNLAA